MNYVTKNMTFKFNRAYDEGQFIFYNCINSGGDWINAPLLILDWRESSRKGLQFLVLLRRSSL